MIRSALLSTRRLERALNGEAVVGKHGSQSSFPDRVEVKICDIDVAGAVHPRAFFAISSRLTTLEYFVHFLLRAERVGNAADGILGDVVLRVAFRGLD